MGEAGIVVVTYESEAEFGACLDRAQPTGAENVVVDNASTDRTCQEVTRRGVRLITNPENRGFAAAGPCTRHCTGLKSRAGSNPNGDLRSTTSAPSITSSPQPARSSSSASIAGGKN